MASTGQTSAASWFTGKSFSSMISSYFFVFSLYFASFKSTFLSFGIQNLAAAAEQARMPMQVSLSKIILYLVIERQKAEVFLRVSDLGIKIYKASLNLNRDDEGC